MKLSIKKNNFEMTVTIASNRNLFQSFFCALITISIGIFALIPFYIFITERLSLGVFLMGLLFFVVFFRLAYYYAGGIVWNYSGYEYLQIDKATGKIVFYRQSIRPFDRKEFMLDDSLMIGLYDQKVHGKDLPPRDNALFSWYGGRIYIRDRNGFFRFGISLGAREAYDLVNDIHLFIDKKN